MKTIIKLICLITITVIGNKSYCQQCVLNMSDVFEDHGCTNWCWVHTSQNIINYYGEASPDELDIVEYAKNKIFTPSPGVTSCRDFPMGCCQAAGLDWVFRNLVYSNYKNIFTDYINNSITGDQLYNEFCFNKPVIIYVDGHYFIAYGIGTTRYWVHIMDAFYGQQIRRINEIYPGGKPWLGTYLMNHSPNWSSYNIIRDVIDRSRCLSSQNGMKVNAVFKKYPLQPDQHFTLSTYGTIELNEGFTVYHGCSLDIYTNNSNCP